MMLSWYVGDEGFRAVAYKISKFMAPQSKDFMQGDIWHVSRVCLQQNAVQNGGVWLEYLLTPFENQGC